MMRKTKLVVEDLSVQSLTTASTSAGRGTVLAHAPTAGGGPNCGSAYDACPTGLCATLSPDACPTYYPEYCESADDACPSGRGCTSLDC